MITTLRRVLEYMLTCRSSMEDLFLQIYLCILRERVGEWGGGAVGRHFQADSRLSEA